MKIRHVISTGNVRKAESDSDVCSLPIAREAVLFASNCAVH